MRQGGTREELLDEMLGVVWLDDGESIRIVLVPKDPLKALRGAGQGEGLLERLLESRRLP